MSTLPSEAALDCLSTYENGLETGTRGVIRLSWKPTFDFLAAVVLLLPIAPIVLIAMLIVRITSRGPALYSQERVGHRGKVFRIYKIRTMKYDCEKQSGPQWSTSNDPRVTPVGRFLRKTHIDEIPQIWNVLRGEMSLVGPRPERPVFVEQLSLALEGYQDRHLVRPGVTGLAQIQLPPDTCLMSVQDKLSYDLFYVENPGAILDLKILLGTTLKVLGLPFDRTRMLLSLPSFDEVRAGQPFPVIARFEAETRSGAQLV